MFDTVEGFGAIPLKRRNYVFCADLNRRGNARTIRKYTISAVPQFTFSALPKLTPYTAVTNNLLRLRLPNRTFEATTDGRAKQPAPFSGIHSRRQLFRPTPDLTTQTEPYKKDLKFPRHHGGIIQRETRAWEVIDNKKLSVRGAAARSEWYWQPSQHTEMLPAIKLDCRKSKTTAVKQVPGTQNTLLIFRKTPTFGGCCIPVTE